jgi:hypothetical protein
MDPRKFIYKIDLSEPLGKGAALPARRHFERVTDEGSWKNESRRLLSSDEIDEETRAFFHEQWIVAGHRMREQLGDDNQLLRMGRPSHNPRRSEWTCRLAR